MTCYKENGSRLRLKNPWVGHQRDRILVRILVVYWDGAKPPDYRLPCGKLTGWSVWAMAEPDYSGNYVDRPLPDSSLVIL